MIPPQNKIFAFLLMSVADLFTWIPLALFACFLFFGSFFHIPLNLDPLNLLLFNLLLSLTFFFQHSFMVRKSFHDHLNHWMPRDLHRALFAVLSGIMISWVVIFWQPSNDPVLTITGLFRWMARGVFVLSIGGFLRAGMVLNSLDASGAKSVKRFLQNEKPSASEFTVVGPYRWVRHPLYFFTFLMIWSFPDITTDRLLFNILWSGWIVVGAHLEEKDLVRAFGDQYRQYQNKVSMLIPTRIKPYSASRNVGNHP